MNPQSPVMPESPVMPAKAGIHALLESYAYIYCFIQQVDASFRWHDRGAS